VWPEVLGTFKISPHRVSSPRALTTRLPRAHLLPTLTSSMKRDEECIYALITFLNSRTYFTTDGQSVSQSDSQSVLVPSTLVAVATIYYFLS
jgi:hypothetical protein